MIYNKKREKNEIINIGVDKDKDIEGYVNIYNEIVDDKIEFVNEISKLFDNVIEKKEFRNLKDDVLKLIGNICIYDVKRKGCKNDNKEKDSDVKRKGCRKDNKEKDSDVKGKGCKKDNNNNTEKDSDDSENDNDNLIDKLLNNKDKLHNFNDKLLNNLFIVAKLKEEILINAEKIRAIFNEIENVPKKDLRLKLNKYKKLNILIGDLINHICRMIYGKNRVNNEIDNIDCDKDENAKRYATKYINIANDKLILINAASDSIDELMEGLDVDTPNDIAIKKWKDFKSILIKSVNKCNLYIKQDIKNKHIEEGDIEKKDIKEEDLKKKDIKKKDIEKKDIKKKDIEKKDIEKKDTKNSIKHVAKINNKPDTGLAASADIKAHITDKQKLIKERYKSLLKTIKTIKNNIELIYTTLKKLLKELQSKLIELVR